MKNKWRIYKLPEHGWGLEHRTIGPWALANSFTEMMENYPFWIQQFNSRYGIESRRY